MELLIYLVFLLVMLIYSYATVFDKDFFCYLCSMKNLTNSLLIILEPIAPFIICIIHHQYSQDIYYIRLLNLHADFLRYEF